MAPQTTFLIGTKIAVETDRGSAPSGNRLGRLWSEGGRWFDLVTDGLPNIRDRQSVIFPAGHAGDRRVNQQQPVVGRKWSEGDFSAPFVSDYMMPLLYGIMGAASTDMTLHATASLMAASPIETNPRSYTLTNQPNEGGAILRFEAKGNVNTGTGYNISISGIDAYGNGASETITALSGNMPIYTRTSFSSIGALGVAISGISGIASLTIIAIKKFTHTFTTASSAPTLAFEHIGDPTAGDASANKSWIYPGQLVKTLSLENNAAQTDGTLVVRSSTMGEPTTATCTATTLNAPSSLRIWPSWMLQVKRDNGTTYNKVSDFSIDMTTGNRNFFAAANAQGPQGGLVGQFEATGKITILVDNEIEFNKWRGASQVQLYALWGGGAGNGWKLTSALNYQFGASIPMFFETDLDDNDQDGALVISGTYRIVRDDSFPFQFQLVNGTPGVAIGNLTSI